MRSIEKLVIWLIPSQILSVACDLIFSMLRAENMVHQSHSSLTGLFSVASSLSYLIGQIVIAIWIYKQEHSQRSSQWAWSLFGLFAGFWGLGIFLLSHIPAIAALFNAPQNPKDMAETPN